MPELSKQSQAISEVVLMNMKQDNESPYPDWKRGFTFGFIAGSIGFAISFMSLYWATTSPDLSTLLPIDLQPWWKLSNWCISIAFFIILFVPISVIISLRPDMKEPKYL